MSYKHRKSPNYQRISLLALFLANLIICAQLSIPLPNVNISMQSFAVLLQSLLLKPLDNVIVTSAYAVIGLLGLPVFSGFKGGFNHVLSPSFGFILGFILSSYLTSLYVQKKLSETSIAKENLEQKAQAGAENQAQTASTKYISPYKYFYKYEIIASLIFTISLYLIGLTYMSLILNVYLGKNYSFNEIMNIGFLIFLPGDIAKVILAILAANRLRPVLANKTKYY